MKDIEKQKEDKNLPQQPASAALPAHEKKAANRIFNIANYIGLGWIANSALSLLITYNVLPTKGGQKFIQSIANTMKPLVKGYYTLFNPAKIGTKQAALHLAERSRSAAEILCMCIAGTLMLIPMKITENYKKPIVDQIHGVTGGEPSSGDAPEPEHEKQTWGKLLVARAAGIASVVGIDQLIQGFNNKRHTRGLESLDTLEWKAGATIYDKMQPSWRDKFIDFFSRKKAGVESIQPAVRERIAQVVGEHPHKMVFAEQTRLLSKEISLTLVSAGIVYALSKTPLCDKLFIACGLKKRPKPETPAAAAVHTASEPEDIPPQKLHTEHIKPRQEGYAEAILTQQQNPSLAGLSA